MCHRKTSLVCIHASIASVFLAAGICALPGATFAAVSVGPVVGGDDNNYAKLVPTPERKVTYCSWINAAMNKYVQANPTYQFSWAGNNATTQSILSDLDVTTYEAWAGTSPDVTGGDGVKRNKGYVKAEAGGANVVFTYTPKQGDPTSVRFIQAYNESLTGSPYQIFLDRGTSATPFYDDKGISGTAYNAFGRLANNVSWFQDRPLDTEPRLMARVPTAEGPNEIDTWSDVQFQVAVAVDNGAYTEYRNHSQHYALRWSVVGLQLLEQR